MPGIFRGKRRRVLLLVLAGLVLAAWLAGRSGDEGLTIRKMAVLRPADWPAELQLDGVWELSSQFDLFGGYSALVALPGGRLRAYSDRGAWLEFDAPPAPLGEIAMAEVVNDPDFVERTQDVEAAYRDSETGEVWLALEFPHSIRRFSPDGQPLIRTESPYTRGWRRNSGAEAMVRLADGRFVILGENKNGALPNSSPGLLFEGDPTGDAEAAEFSLQLPGRFRPTDMALLPDGRALIVMRAVAIDIPPFRSALAIADPATIEAGEAWEWELLAELDSPFPVENFEGAAVVEGADGTSTIWLISDDNTALLQRTLLVALRWDPAQAGQEEARGDSPALSD